MNIKERIRAMLQISDYTVCELAEEVGCSASHVSRYITKQVELGNVICVLKSQRKAGLQKVNARYSWGADSKEDDLIFRARLYLLDIKGIDKAGIDLICDMNDYFYSRTSQLFDDRPCKKQ